MIVALDTDVLVDWAMQSAPRHELTARYIQAQRERRARFALVPQALFEFVHVVTDPRRFPVPMPMSRAAERATLMWNAPDAVRVLPDVTVPGRVAELIRIHRLGRKRILDTALAATLEAVGIESLATFNDDDFAIFGFLSLVNPAKTG